MTVKIELDPARDLCARHREPFRQNWPQGVMIAMLLSVDAFTQTPECAAYTNCESRNISAALREFSPMCCHVFAGLMDEIIEASLSGDLLRVNALQERIRSGQPKPPDRTMN